MSWRGSRARSIRSSPSGTHDLDEVRGHLFVFDTRVGAGRLAATSLDDTTTAGRFVESELLRHLDEGPAPERALFAANAAALRGLLSEQRIALDEWRFRVDPKDAGLAAGFEKPATDVSGWRTIRAGAIGKDRARITDEPRALRRRRLVPRRRRRAGVVRRARRARRLRRDRRQRDRLARRRRGRRFGDPATGRNRLARAQRRRGSAASRPAATRWCCASSTTAEPVDSGSRPSFTTGPTGAASTLLE